jgi:lysozyme
MPSPKRKKNRGWKWLIAGCSLLMAGMILYNGWLWWRERNASFVRYPAFGIDIPVNYKIHGIDVSHHQDVIDWKSVKAMNVSNIRLGFAFMKATQGVNFKDNLFERNWEKAKAAGMVRGAYHFFMPNRSGREQALYFIKNVQLEKGDLPPVLDIEETYNVSKDVLQREALEWLRLVEQHYGVKPILYTYVNFYEQYLDKRFDAYPLWVAHYLEKRQPRISRNWIIWQHSETGRVNGITERVDFNAFRGDSSDFERLRIR